LLEYRKKDKRNDQPNGNFREPLIVQVRLQERGNDADRLQVIAILVVSSVPRRLIAYSSLTSARISLCGMRLQSNANQKRLCGPVTRGLWLEGLDDDKKFSKTPDKFIVTPTVKNLRYERTLPLQVRATEIQRQFHKMFNPGRVDRVNPREIWRHVRNHNICLPSL
jgi:hypothetical protein